MTRFSAAGGRRLIAPVYALVLSLVVMGPLLGPGYLLLRDAVSTPRSYLTDSALGLTDAAARAVPQDAVVAVASWLVDGGIVVKAMLLLALWLAGWGASAMVTAVLPSPTTLARITAATVAIWNPYVAERLLQGHWSLLVGYAALPWTALAATKIRAGDRRAWWSLVACLTAAGLTPTGVLLAAIVAVVVLASRDTLSSVALAVGIAAAASLPWLTATAISGGGAGASDPAGVAAFAARAEPGLGTIGSLAGLGGIWNSSAVPDSRTTWFAVVGTAVLLAIVITGIVKLRGQDKHGLLGLAVVTIAILALAATPWGLDVGRWASVHVPGAGLLRDGQKWVALAMPAYVLAAGAACASFARLEPRKRRTCSLLHLLLLLTLPDLAWGVGGALKPVEYPAGWAEVAQRVGPDDGDVAVLPAGMFRQFGYSGDAPVLDPAPRMLRADVLQTGELIVAGGTVKGEGKRAEEVQSVLLRGGSPQELQALGVGWVLLEKGTPGELGQSNRTTQSLEIAYTDGDLALYRVPGTHGTQSTLRWLQIATHAVWSVLLLAGLGMALGLGRRMRRP